MTTYADILLKKELIISLAKQFGFTEAVKIHYDLPYEGEENIELCFIVMQARGDLSYKNRNWLAVKLSMELDCSVNVIVQEGIDELYVHDHDRKSALITDEKALRRVIYQINNELDKNTKIDDTLLNQVKFEEIECKKVISEDDQSLQRIILKHADEYLRKSLVPQAPSISDEAYRRNSLLSPEKKHQYDKDSGSSDTIKESDKKKLRSVSAPESREKSIDTPNIRKNSC